MARAIPALLLFVWLSPSPYSTTALRLECSSYLILNDISQNHYCSTSGDINTTVTWSHTSPAGEITPLASCPGLGSCTLFNNLSLWVIRNDRSVTFRTADIVEGMEGTLACTEIFSNGSKDTANCAVRVDHVRMACAPRLTFYEGETQSFGCSIPRFSTIYWRLVTADNRTINISTCYHPTTCTTPENPNFSADQSYHPRFTAHSSITLNNITRNMTGAVVCTDGIQEASCPLHVVGRPKLTQ